jgi:hypothetical protein
MIHEQLPRVFQPKVEQKGWQLKKIGLYEPESMWYISKVHEVSKDVKSGGVQPQNCRCKTQFELLIKLVKVKGVAKGSNIGLNECLRTIFDLSHELGSHWLPLLSVDHLWKKSNPHAVDENHQVG